MKNKMTIGSPPLKVHYGGEPKNPPSSPGKKSAKAKRTEDSMARDAQESNLKYINQKNN